MHIFVYKNPDPWSLCTFSVPSTEFCTWEMHNKQCNRDAVTQAGVTWSTESQIPKKTSRTAVWRVTSGRMPASPPQRTAPGKTVLRPKASSQTMSSAHGGSGCWTTQQTCRKSGHSMGQAILHGMPRNLPKVRGFQLPPKRGCCFTLPVSDRTSWPRAIPQEEKAKRQQRKRTWTSANFLFPPQRRWVTTTSNLELRFTVCQRLSHNESTDFM